MFPCLGIAVCGDQVFGLRANMGLALVHSRRRWSIPTYHLSTLPRVYLNFARANLDVLLVERLVLRSVSSSTPHGWDEAVSYTHLRAHETEADL
eukprot:494077-Amphidinium_carterae.1